MVSTNAASGTPSPYYRTTTSAAPAAITGQNPVAGAPVASQPEAGQNPTAVMPGQGSDNQATARSTSAFNPDGWKMPMADRGKPAANLSEMNQSLMQIVKAFESLQPPGGDGPFSQLLGKLSAASKRLAQMAGQQASAAIKEAQKPASQASDASDASPVVAGADSAGDPSNPVQNAAPGNDLVPTQEGEAPAGSEGPEAPEGSSEAPEGPEAEGGEEAGGPAGAEGSGDQADPGSRPEAAGEAGDAPHHHDEGVATSDAKPIQGPPPESASQALARLKDKNMKHLLENLMNREMYKQLCDALASTLKS